MIMRTPLIIRSLLLSIFLLTTPGACVLEDEAYEVDWHIPLVGASLFHSTFFHRPLPESKASVIYTLTDQHVIAAVLPKNGSLIWRQTIEGDANLDGLGKPILRPGHGQVISAAGRVVRAWDATDGRLVWASEFNSAVKDIQVNTDGAVWTLLGDGSIRKLNGISGSVFDEVHNTVQFIGQPEDAIHHSLHILSTAATIVSLVPSTEVGVDSYTLQTTTIFRPTSILTYPLPNTQIASASSIVYVGKPGIAAWTEVGSNSLFLLALGGEHVASVDLPAEATKIRFITSSGNNAFIVAYETEYSSWAQIWTLEGEAGQITKQHDIAPKTIPHTSWSANTASDGKIYFTWSLPGGSSEVYSASSSTPVASFTGESTAIPGSSLSISEVIPRSDNTFALRTFLTSYPDGNTHLIRNGGLPQWTRPESLAGLKAAVWVELLDPVTEEIGGDLHVEETQNVLSAYIHRVKRHIHELTVYGPAWAAELPNRLVAELTGTTKAKADEGCFRDAFGFRKFVVGVARNGGVAVIDVGNKGHVVWNLDRVFEEEDIIRGIYEIGKGVVGILTHKGKYVKIDAFTGTLLEQSFDADVRAVLTTAVVEVGGEHKAILAIIENKQTGAGEARYFGASEGATVAKDFYLVAPDESGYIGGLKVSPGSLTPDQTFVFTPPRLEVITGIVAPARSTPPASIGRVLGDRSVMYKYLNPHLILVTTARIDSTGIISVYLLDSVSGALLYTASHTGADTGKPIVSVVYENWFVYSFFSDADLKDAPPVKGYQLVVTELYESEFKNDRGPLGTQANISAFAPDVVQSKPHAISQSYVFPAPILSLATTSTKQSITTTDILAFLGQPAALLTIPKRYLDARRPVDREPDNSEKEEGLFRYDPVIQLDTRSILTHKRELLPVKGNAKIMTSPTLMESTSLVFLYTNTDIFGTRISPSGTFDMLGKGFGKLQLVATVVGLAIGVWAVAPMVRKKQINQRWIST
ncbi:hypothetical protein DFH27DRAFT_502102 [Peziza echinospora]|nr:hypothetical protein DFH27DRAFT_502102 [Peziza echinospora]